MKKTLFILLVAAFHLANAQTVSVDAIAGNVDTAFSVSHNGTGAGAAISINNTFNGSDLLKLSSIGTGKGIDLSISNVNNLNPAINISRNGFGAGLIMSLTNNNSPADALYITSAGNGNGATMQLTNQLNESPVMNIVHAGKGKGIYIQMPNTSNHAAGLSILHQGTGVGIYTESMGSVGVWAVSKSIVSAGVLGENYQNGDGIVGRSNAGIQYSGVVGVCDSSGSGIKGFSKYGIGVLGQSGTYQSSGMAGRFENIYSGNNNNVLEVTTVSSSASNLVVMKKNNVVVARINDAGKGFFNGGTQSSGADMAEAFDVADDIRNYVPGDVLIISVDKDRAVIKSNQPYSNLVAGVFATKPGMLMTEEDVDADLSDKVPMGVVGVIPTKVCIEGGEINRGDFLVTSSLAGIAMKGDPGKIKPGQVIGKALENYSSNTIGKIRVLVNVK
jgi:hypothetical protein